MCSSLALVWEGGLSAYFALSLCCHRTDSAFPLTKSHSAKRKQYDDQLRQDDCNRTELHCAKVISSQQKLKQGNVTNQKSSVLSAAAEKFLQIQAGTVKCGHEHLILSLQIGESKTARIDKGDNERS